MLTEDILAREFTRIVSQYYPQVGELLKSCHVKIIRGQWGRPAKHFQYVGIYCSEEMMIYLQAHHNLLRDIAENMGLVQVVFLNATRLLRDPMSKLKQSDPRLWLELHLLAA
ncbi:MAG: hypothetical protein QNJ51_27185 [Calothrix sp. MO_167.B12]|nr:hypothetical protein [Calothrix sp. MO_167.B12]